MEDPIGQFAGCLLIAIIGIWGVAFLGHQFVENLKDGKVVDQTSSELDASDHPGTALLQFIGFTLAIVGAVIAAIAGIITALAWARA